MIITRNGKEIEIADLTPEHKYAFDTRVTRHEHLSDGTIVRLDTLDQFQGKILVKRMTKQEFQTAMIPEVKVIV